MNPSVPYPFVEFALVVGTWDVTEIAFPDTGFDGGLIIPEGVGREIIASAGTRKLVLPGRYLVTARYWGGSLTIDDHTTDVEVIAYGDRYLLGRDVLDQGEFCFSFGRELRIRFG